MPINLENNKTVSTKPGIATKGVSASDVRKVLADAAEEARHQAAVAAVEDAMNAARLVLAARKLAVLNAEMADIANDNARKQQKRVKLRKKNLLDGMKAKRVKRAASRRAAMTLQPK